MNELSSDEYAGESRERIGTGIGRRNLLKTTGVVLAGGLLLSGSASAHGGAVGRSGSDATVGDGTARAYTERARGKLSAVGVEFDASALSGLPTDPTAYHLALPRGDAGRFEFVGMDYNPTGHDPLPLYGHEHFDFHFYMLDEETVAGIGGGPVTYDIPDALMPANTVTTADLPASLGGPQPRFAIPGMGEHLFSIPASLPGSPGGDGWSVFIWGASDPDGDGTGQLTFAEPMITTAYLSDLRGGGNADTEARQSIPTPDRFLKGGRYPTEFVVRYHSHDDTFTVSLESFEGFAGYGRR